MERRVTLWICDDCDARVTLTGTPSDVYRPPTGWLSGDRDLCGSCRAAAPV